MAQWMQITTQVTLGDSESQTSCLSDLNSETEVDVFLAFLQINFLEEGKCLII